MKNEEVIEVRENSVIVRVDGKFYERLIKPPKGEKVEKYDPPINR